MSTIPVYRFQYKEQDKIPFEILRIEDNPFLSRGSLHPRRDSFFIVFRITAGSGEYHIDFNRFEIMPDSLFFIAPGQVHYWSCDQPIHGDAILFEDDLFQLQGHSTFLEELDLFDFYDQFAKLDLTEVQMQSTNNLIEQMYREYTSQHFKRPDMLVSLLKIFLIEAERAMPTIDPDRAQTASHQLTRQFIELARKQVIKNHGPVKYAQQLGVTPGHLSETIKSNLGLTAGKYLRQRLVLEIKRWLVHSDLTINQIAEKLNFQDPSYLGRYFKRETDQSPGAFRKDFRKKYQNRRI